MNPKITAMVATVKLRRLKHRTHLSRDSHGAAHTHHPANHNRQSAALP
ncbi:MAG TPA: hypothetical protein VHJ19_10635 [Gammaproteobacteria bacterium]|nr:hypothetical protein [Gammaproteobacteria bacterium]